MQNEVILPSWLDNLIYDKMGAQYCRANGDLTAIDWDKTQVLNYLGTYFPRSYTESLCIFRDFFNSKTYFSSNEEISVLDFGSGTGGEIIGLLTVLTENRPNLKKVTVKALDGNRHALRAYEKVLAEFSKRTNLEIINKISSVKIDDIYDLGILRNIIEQNYDIIISFKAVCEFVTKQQFEERNAYQYLGGFLNNKLKENGIMLLVDVSSYNNISQQWLPDMMDKGLKAAGCYVADRNEGYNCPFFVSHSRRTHDISKVAWRLIKKDVNEKLIK